MFLPDDTFRTVVDSTPLVSIDLIVKNSEGQVLLGKRNNKPAKDFWFVPGGRIQKNETMSDAFTRLCKEELGLEKRISDAVFLGPYEHFYNDSIFDNVSTHYVVLGYQITLDRSLGKLPDKQHCDYKWMNVEEAVCSESVYKYSRDYFIN
ncbi:MAG: GDP-mannose mannosyl hydrolase [Alteromonadaceae bacterium]|nr:GDP-mannose mannosyl hydrolase [Alteromonadaceae bacterium]